MLVLTPKYGSQIDLDLLKKQKKETYITHRKTLDLNHCEDIKEAYLAFLNNKDKYVIGYKPQNDDEINEFVKSLGEIDTLDVSWIDVSELESLRSCFCTCEAKHIVGLEKWDVSNVKDMFLMFKSCENLESIGDISMWDVSNVKDMTRVFAECDNLKNIGDISTWDVSNVKDMYYMFAYCYNLNNIGDISGWDVSNVKSMQNMFAECEKLKSVGDLERWNVPGNEKIQNMFEKSAITPIPSWYHE